MYIQIYILKFYFKSHNDKNIDDFSVKYNNSIIHFDIYVNCN